MSLPRLSRTLLVCALTGCGAAPPSAQVATPGSGPGVRTAANRPPVAVIARDGDPLGAFAVAVTTEGIDPPRGAEVAVALAALVEGRLAEGHTVDASVAPAWDGFRVRTLIGSAAGAPAFVEAVRRALLAPVRNEELPGVRRKLDALARRPMADAALLEVARCTGEPFALPGRASEAASLETLERWRRSANGLGRVAMAAVGRAPVVDSFAGAVTLGAPWPVASPPAAEAPVAPGRVDVYDASPDLPPGTARATLVVRAGHAEPLVAAAAALGAPRGALSSRLLSLDVPARLEQVTATAHVGGGCLALSLMISARDLASDGATQVATAVALARQEVLAELAETPLDRSLPASLAGRAGDPRESADRAAWWTLAATATPPAATSALDPRVSVIVGLAEGRDAGQADPDLAARAAMIRAALDRATLAWRDPAVEGRARVERGQGELWLLLGSPCGTLSETELDAGLGAVVAFAAAERAIRQPGVAAPSAEGWAAPDGIGVIVHAPRAPGEAPGAQARRIADAAARSFAAEPLDALGIAHARATLLARAGETEDARAFTALAGVLSPRHPSWIAALGTADSLGRASDAAVIARASALRSGPLRIAVLADADAAQADAALHAVDRWVPRKSGEARACSSAATAAAAQPGTYAMEIPGASASEAWLALTLAADDEPARASAMTVAAALDGPDGLLARTLGPGLARAWGARVIGPSRASALVIRLVSAPAALDAAVSQVRALLDRLRQGGLAESDRARALDVLATSDRSSSLDPKNRLIALWRGERTHAGAELAPSLDALRAFAATALRDEALIVVAARSPRNTRSP